MAVQPPRPMAFRCTSGASTPRGAMRGLARGHRPGRHGGQETTTARPQTPRARRRPWGAAPNRP